MAGRSLVMTRPRLERALDGALSHRVALVVADAGFGKTSLLTSWSRGITAGVHDVTDADNDLTRLADRLMSVLRLRLPGLPQGIPGIAADTAGVSDSRPDAIAEACGRVLQQHLHRDVVLVLDNVHLLDSAASIGFLAALIRHSPPMLHMVLASRTPPPIVLDRLRDRGEVIELHGSELDFTNAEVAELLTTVIGSDAADLAAAVRDATAGWPVAVRLCVESLRDVPSTLRPAYLADLSGGHGQITRLASAIYRQEPPDSKRLLAAVALFDEVTVPLLDAIGVAGAAELTALFRRGLFVEPGASGTGWYRLHAIAAEVVEACGMLPGGDAAQLRASAGKWFVEHGMPHLALRALTAAGHHAELGTLLMASGTHLLWHGHAAEVAEAIAGLPAEVRRPELDRLAGEAHQLRGEWAAALDCYLRAAPDEHQLDQGLAWRMGLIHYLRGELDLAVSVYQRAQPSASPDRDTALLLAWQASAHWMRGEAEQCGALAVRAMAVADQVDDPQALAAAHTVLAMLAAFEGDRRANDAHYVKALRFAEQAGDVLQQVRIRNNRGSRHLEEGSYGEALHELDTAIRLADLSGFAAFGALALCNRGEAYRDLGRLEEAHQDLAAAAAAFAHLGSGLVANALVELGTLYYLRGDAPAARRTYDDALSRAQESGDVQSMLPALIGLAWLLAEDDPEAAAEFADRAIAAGPGMCVVDALLAAGRVRLCIGDTAAARRYAREAAAAAESRRDVPGRAEALALEAAAVDDDAAAIQLAERSIALWSRTHNPIGQAKAELVRATRLPLEDARHTLELVRDRMQAIGCRLVAGQASAALDRLDATDSVSLRVETLGGFRLVRDGTIVTNTVWKSRKARDLLKILISRRGRAITHENLMDLLWPGETPESVGNRFNVLVSTVRAILDPGRRLHPEGFVVNDSDSCRLESRGIDLDVEAFLADAAAGFRAVREGREQYGISLLKRAEQRYGGEFLEEDSYQDWAAPLREEARTTYRQVAACLAAHARRTGEIDAAIRYLLRSLERDPYDERTHLNLIAALSASGRHGDARRYYRTYCKRMRELDVEAAPFPAQITP